MNQGHSVVPVHAKHWSKQFGLQCPWHVDRWTSGWPDLPGESQPPHTNCLHSTSSAYVYMFITFFLNTRHTLWHCYPLIRLVSPLQQLSLKQSYRPWSQCQTTSSAHLLDMSTEKTRLCLVECPSKNHCIPGNKRRGQYETINQGYHDYSASVITVRNQHLTTCKIQI